MSDPTAQDVLMWALINRARLDPAGEAARDGIDLNEGLAPGTISSASKQPLAWNASLFTAADQHSAYMLTNNYFGHQGSGESAPGTRETAAGFPSQSWWGENIAWQGSSAPLDATQTIISEEQGLFTDTSVSGRGHRLNILNDNFQEVGVSQEFGAFQGQPYASALTQDFGTPLPGGQFLTGIAYNDSNADGFYSVGEGRGNISVSVSGGSVATAGPGEYSEAIGSGSQIVTFSGGDLGAPVTVTATITAGRNALLDLVGQSTVETSVSLTAGNGVTKIIGLGNYGLTLTGNGLGDTFVAPVGGNNTFTGGTGFDTAVYAGNRASYTITPNADNSITVTGANGTDRLVSIEKIQFADQIYTPPGTSPGSVSINDVNITEGNSGTQLATFTVTRTGGTAAFSVNFATADGTATVADNDYVTNSGTLQFGAGDTSKTVSVTINGDTKPESNETFSVLLSNATNGATISDNQGVGTIINDDATPVAGSVSINDVNITEGNSGTQLATFTVTRTGGTAAFSVNFATADGTATVADNDYVANSGTLQFGAGDTSKTVSVTINGDTKPESNETFSVLLSNATNGATISDNQGVGTIINDDVAASGPDLVVDSISAPASIRQGDSFSFSYIVDNIGNTVAGQHYAGFNVDGAVDENDYYGWNAVSSLSAHQLATLTNSIDTSYLSVGQHTLYVKEDFWQNEVDESNETNNTRSITFNVTAATKPARDDFNGDGTSDILFRNDATGATWYSEMSNGAVGTWQSLGSSATSYSVVGVGDFYGNGTSEELVRNGSGDTWFQEMSNGAPTSWQEIGGSNPAYSVVGVADFYGNGTDDILYRNNATGDTWFEAISDGTMSGWHQIGSSSTAYSIVGTGDFYGNGTDDILYRNNATGDTWFQSLSGGIATGWNQIGGTNPNYSVVGVADFYGTGTDDILFRNNSTGDTWFAAMSNGAVAGWYQVASTNTAYSVVGTGDYDGNGTSDILMRNSATGDTWFAAMSNGAFNGWHEVSATNTGFTVKT